MEEFHPQRNLTLISIYEELLSEFKFGGEFPAKYIENGNSHQNQLESIIAWNQTKIQKSLDDRLPDVCPFAILYQVCTQKLQQVNSSRKITEKKLSKGILIESQEAIYGC